METPPPDSQTLHLCSKHRRFKPVWRILLISNLALGAYIFAQARKKNSSAEEAVGVSPIPATAPVVVNISTDPAVIGFAPDLDSPEVLDSYLDPAIPAIVDVAPIPATISPVPESPIPSAASEVVEVSPDPAALELIDFDLDPSVPRAVDVASLPTTISPVPGAVPHLVVVTPVSATIPPIPEKTTLPLAAPAIWKTVWVPEPVPEDQQREICQWILEEKRKVKPINREEKKRLDEEKAILKQFIRADYIRRI